VINQLQTQPDELALVLDDYHLIEDTAIQDSLAFLLSHRRDPRAMALGAS